MSLNIPSMVAALIFHLLQLFKLKYKLYPTDCRQGPRRLPRIFLLKKLEMPLFSRLLGFLLV